MAEFELFYRTSIVLCAVYCLINSAEILSVLRARGQIVPENYYRYSYPQSLAVILGYRFSIFQNLNAASMLLATLCVLRIFASTLVLSFSGANEASLLLMIALTLVINYLRPVGGDGAMQMAVVVMLPLAIANYFEDEMLASSIAAIFISAQITLAYFAAGISKLGSATWVKGMVIRDVLSTESYGNQLFASLFQRFPKISRLLCYSIIALQLFFPIWLILPENFVLMYLGVMAFFHLGLAVAMGLNDFPWVFWATYPMVYFVSTTLL